MKFTKYNSLENHYRQKFIDQIILQGLGDLTYIATEKAHGANFSYHYDGETFRVAKRSGFCDENFYNCKELIERDKQKVIDLYHHIKKLHVSDMKHLCVDGEIVGGKYQGQEKDFPNAKRVQKEVEYCPSNHFIGFDVRVDNNYIDMGSTISLLDRFNIARVPIIKVGSLEDCLAVSNEFDSVIPEKLGYPNIENNICEGVVIEPLYSPQYLSNGSRVIIKSKNAKFREQGGKKVKVRNVLNLSPEQHALGENLTAYFTEQRISNVLSKHTDSLDWKQFMKFAGLFFQDALEDYNEDTSTDLRKVLGDEWKCFVRVYKAISDSKLREYFKKNI